jgi:hypothetical protein
MLQQKAVEPVTLELLKQLCSEAEKDPDPICIVPISWTKIKSKLTKAVIDYTNQFL